MSLTRLSTSESAKLKVADRRGRTVRASLKTFERLMRSATGATHPIDARLVRLVGTVSNHFGGRKVEIVSGFRPYSNHNSAHAIDFRVAGVPNEALRD